MITLPTNRRKEVWGRGEERREEEERNRSGGEIRDVFTRWRPPRSVSRSDYDTRAGKIVQKFGGGCPLLTRTMYNASLFETFETVRCD